MTTTDPFTEAARAEAEQRWPEWPLGYAPDRLAFEAGAEWARTHLAVEVRKAKVEALRDAAPLMHDHHDAAWLETQAIEYETGDNDEHR